MNQTLNLNTISLQSLSRPTSGYLGAESSAQNLREFTRLDLGVNLLGCSPKVLAAIQAVKLSQLTHYSPPTGVKTKQAIAQVCSSGEEHILLGSSSDELIAFLAQVILERGDKAAIVHPNFFRYTQISQAAGAGSVDIFAQADENFEFTPRLVQEIIQTINAKSCAVLWLSNPVNPTGVVISQLALEKILAETAATVILDEAFIEYYDAGYQEKMHQLVKLHQNLIIVKTFSKAYGLAGVRCGYLLTHPQTNQKLSKLYGPLSMTSELTQVAVRAALADQAWLAGSVATTRQLFAALQAQINALGTYDWGGQSRSNVFLLRHPHQNLHQELKKHKILTANFSSTMGLEGKGYTRITVGTAEQNQQLVVALQAIAKNPLGPLHSSC